MNWRMCIFQAVNPRRGTLINRKYLGGGLNGREEIELAFYQRIGVWALRPDAKRRLKHLKELTRR